MNISTKDIVSNSDMIKNYKACRDRAEVSGKLIILKNNQPDAVLFSITEYERLSVFIEYLESLEFEAYETLLPQVVGGEFRLPELPILYNLPFGHTSPTCVLPHGAMAEIDCDNGLFSILESGVV